MLHDKIEPLDAAKLAHAHRYHPRNIAGSGIAGLASRECAILLLNALPSAAALKQHLLVLEPFEVQKIRARRAASEMRGTNVAGSAY